MFRTQSLRYGYNKSMCFHFPDIKLSAAEGLLISGKSGIDKTIFLHLIAGLLRPDRGGVVLTGARLRCIVVLLLFISLPGFSQTKITWETLTDVEFTDKYSEEVDAYYYFPNFGSTVKKFEGKEVYLKGFMLAIDPNKGIYVLSRNPFASCFFCGNGSPASIVELKLKPDHPEFSMDQVVTIKGKLILNDDDIYQCNYILEGAEVYEE